MICRPNTEIADLYLGQAGSECRQDSATND
jgi:hypothetical protein